jgi:hypothetical protein
MHHRRPALLDLCPLAALGGEVDGDHLRSRERLDLLRHLAAVHDCADCVAVHPAAPNLSVVGSLIARAKALTRG